MKKSLKTFLRALVVLSVFVIFSVPVQAETIDCQAITSVPTIIDSQGIFCLTGHIATNLSAGNAITITVNNVIIDLNGFKIGNLAAGNSTQAKGIYAYQRSNITIKNGTIRGFEYGIHLDDDSPFTVSQGNSIHHIRADQNTQVGMVISGIGNVIRNNVVVDTGGSTNDNVPDAAGIVALGFGNLVKDNNVYNTIEKTAEAYGIVIAMGNGTVAWNNTVGNAAFGSGTSYGIDIEDSVNVLVRNNNVTAMDYCIYFAGSGDGKYKDNLTSGCPNPCTGGIDSGGNDCAYYTASLFNVEQNHFYQDVYAKLVGWIDDLIS